MELAKLKHSTGGSDVLPSKTVFFSTKVLWKKEFTASDEEVASTVLR